MVDELSKEKRIKTIAPYLVLVIFVFLLSIFLLSSLSRDFLKTLVRMGIPFPNKQTFSLEVNTKNLEPGSVVAYKSYAQNTDGNWGETELKTFSVESGTTTYGMTTHETTTLTPPPTCSLEGDPCKFDEHCCYGYCCSGICSSSECKEELGFWWYLITIPIFIAIILIIYWMKSSRETEETETEEDEFEKLKEKWGGRFLMMESLKNIRRIR